MCRLQDKELNVYNLTMKRSVILSIIILVAIFLVIAGIALRKKDGELPITGDDKPPSGQLPTPLPGTSGADGTGLLPSEINLVAPNLVYNYFAYSENRLVLVQPDGQIVEMNNGQAEILSSTVIENLIEVSFSFDGKKILVVFGERQAPSLSVFDREDKTWEPIEANFQEADWSPDDYKIVFFTEGGGANVLSTLDLGNPKARVQKRLEIHEQGLAPEWIGSNQIILKEKSSALVRGSLWEFDIKNKTLKPIIKEGLGLAVQWNDEGDQGLVFVSSANSRGGELSLIDNQGKTLTRLNFLTLVSKCAFSVGIQTTTTTEGEATEEVKKFLNCAVPKNPSALRNSQLPDDYYKKALLTSDNFFRVDLEDGGVTALFAGSGGQDFDALNLRVVGKKLFFVNRFDQGLYAISL